MLPPQRCYPSVLAAVAACTPGWWSCPVLAPLEIQREGEKRIMQKGNKVKHKPLGVSRAVLPSLLSPGKSLLLSWIMQGYMGAFRAISHVR